MLLFFFFFFCFSEKNLLHLRKLNQKSHLITEQLEGGGRATEYQTPEFFLEGSNYLNVDVGLEVEVLTIGATVNAKSIRSGGVFVLVSSQISEENRPDKNLS